MIVGSGLLARAFAPLYAADPATVIFASGVSNSAESDAAAFRRERELLQHHIDAHPARLVYFGSCNVNNPDQRSHYFDHKRKMEAIVRASRGGLVVRLPQVVGTTSNPNTLTNHLHHQIANGMPLTIWTRAERNLIDVDDVAAIGHHLLESNQPLPDVVSIASPWTLPMREVVQLFETALARRAILIEVDRGEAMNIDSRIAEEAAQRIGLDFGHDYPLRVIRKYYGPSHET